MKRKSAELDVDFIGGQDPMTKEEEKAISEFLKAQILLKAQKQIRSTKTTQQKKIIA
ncbi:MAG: hypothetical protein NTY07_09850 [Bacteroidia bacterium]|nr:hypothetical protein [Bacteroidia bacterium]